MRSTNKELGFLALVWNKAQILFVAKQQTWMKQPPVVYVEETFGKAYFGYLPKAKEWWSLLVIYTKKQYKNLDF